MNTINLNLTPEKIVYRINYSDGSGPKLLVSLSPKREVHITQHEDPPIMVEYEDIQWLRDALEDMQSIIEAHREEEAKKPQINQ